MSDPYLDTSALAKWYLNEARSWIIATERNVARPSRRHPIETTLGRAARAGFSPAPRSPSASG